MYAHGPVPFTRTEVNHQCHHGHQMIAFVETGQELTACHSNGSVIAHICGAFLTRSLLARSILIILARTSILTYTFRPSLRGDEFISVARRCLRDLLCIVHEIIQAILHGSGIVYLVLCFRSKHDIDSPLVRHRLQDFPCHDLVTESLYWRLRPILPIGSGNLGAVDLTQLVRIHHLLPII